MNRLTVVLAATAALATTSCGAVLTRDAQPVPTTATTLPPRPPDPEADPTTTTTTTEPADRPLGSQPLWCSELRAFVHGGQQVVAVETVDEARLALGEVVTSLGRLSRDASPTVAAQARRLYDEVTPKVEVAMTATTLDEYREIIVQLTANQGEAIEILLDQATGSCRIGDLAVEVPTGGGR